MRKGVKRLVSVEVANRKSLEQKGVLTAEFVVFELTSENLTGLGSGMGTERTRENWRRLFRTLEGAKEAALKDYRRSRPTGAIIWRKDGRNGWSSGDLRYVMYDIRKVEVED